MLLNDDLDDVLEDDLDLVRVRGAREMMEHRLLDLFLLLVRLDQIQETFGNEIFGGFLVAWRSLIVGNVFGERKLIEFGIEEIHLVEEEDDAGLGEESVVHDVLEQLEALREPVRLAVFQKNLQREKKY